MAGMLAGSYGHGATSVAGPTDPAEGKRVELTGWPQVRGPNYDGHADATPLIDGFDAAGPPVLWTRALGAGYSSFACDDRRVYTQYQTWGGQYLVCLDALTGETIWERRYEGPYDPAGLYPGPRATPTLALGKVYFSAPSGRVGCLDARTGELLWTVDSFERFNVKPVEFGYSCSPTVLGRLVLLPVGSPGASMVALDAATGRTVWQMGDDPISHVPALPITWHEQKLVLGYLRNALVAYRLEDGSANWRLPLSTAYDEHAAWPIYREPHLWISGPFRAGSQLLELIDRPPGYQSVWKSKLLSNDVCSSVLVGEHLYGFDIRDVQTKLHRPSRGQFRCLEYASGRECWANGFSGHAERRPESESVLAAQDNESSSIGQASVIYADGKLVMFNDLGELILAKADPQEYRELGRVRVLGGEICWTSPALAQGRLYVRNHSRAACVLLAKSDGVNPGRPTLTTADIPQTTYRDWSAMILAVEPRYAMDLPSGEMLWLWYKLSLGMLCGAGLLAALVTVGSAWIRNWIRKLLPRSRSPADGINSAGPMAGEPCEDAARTESAVGSVSPVLWLFWSAAIIAGALGTTLVSMWLGKFVFTWPLCLFALLHAVIERTGPRKKQTGFGRVIDFALVIAFLLVCLAYFLVCRRLGLAFEWVFLSGFVAAVPFLLAARRQARARLFPRLGQALLVASGFSAYYWASVAVLAWRYRA